MTYATKLKRVLEALNIPVKNFKVNKPNGHDEIIIVGGIELIYRYGVLKTKEELGDFTPITLEGEGNNDLFLRKYVYVNTKYEIEHLEKLLEFRKMKSISKEESLEHFVTKKEDLVSKIVYIHEENPSTNSLALAKQFKLKHKHVIEQIFKLAEQNPSMLMGIKYGVYESEVKGVGRPSNTETTGSKIVVEDSAGINTAIKYDTFLHISEDVYYNFINNMGTPKTTEMKVYRYIKRNEYLKGFQRLREHMKDLGYKEKDIEHMIKKRTIITNELMTTVYDYTTHYNNNSGVGINMVALNKLIFVLVDSILGIDAKNFKDKIKDRNEREERLQELLVSLESKFVMIIKFAKIDRKHIIDSIKIGLDLTDKDLEEHLVSMNSLYLLKQFKN